MRPAGGEPMRFAMTLRQPGYVSRMNLCSATVEDRPKQSEAISPKAGIQSASDPNRTFAYRTMIGRRARSLTPLGQRRNVDVSILGH